MFLRWTRGRQEGSYSKLALLPTWLSKLLNVDAYLLKFPPGCSVMRHRDPVATGYKHRRMNITLTGDPTDKMYIEGPIKRWYRFEVFAPDQYFHGLQPIKTKMYMLSFGCRIKE